MKLKEIDNKKKYLVTGAAGFIGMHLSKKLLELGCKVVGYDNLNDYYDINLKHKRLEILKKYNSFHFYKADIEDKTYLENVFCNEEIDIVIHLAAQAGVRYSIENPEIYIQSNIIGFYNILELSRRHNIEHLLYASSSSVYGSNKKTQFSTQDNVDKPISLYAATKKSNELMAHSYSHLYNIPTTGMRFFTVYGPYGRPDMAYYSFTESIYKENPIAVFNNGEMYRDFTYIDDTICAIIPLIENSSALRTREVPYKIYNIGKNKPDKLLDFITTIERTIGKEAIKEYYPIQNGDVYYTYADVKDLIDDVGFKPRTPLKTGIQEFVKWYQNLQGAKSNEK